MADLTEYREPGRSARNRPRHGRVVSGNARASAVRVSWGLADQAVSSLTNFAVGVVVARSLGTTAFGVFTVAWVTYTLVLNLSRGLATDPMAVRFSGVPEPAWRAAAARSSGTALAIGLIAGSLCLIAGLAIGGSVGPGFIALGLVLPALLLQDSWRYAFFAAGQGRRACTNDVVWATALVPTLLLANQQDDVFWFVLAWGAAGAVAAGFGVVQTRIRPHVAGTRSWLGRHRDLGPRYMIENVAASGGVQLRMYGVGVIAGLSDVGTIRGAELLMGPFLMVLMGLSLVMVPEAARVLRRSAPRLRAFCMLLGGVQAGGALVWGLALLVLSPDAAGREVLGSVWASASDLVLPATLTVAAAGVGTAAATGLRALGAARRSVRCQLLASSGYVIGGLIGAAAGGALGSAWGVAVAVMVAAAVWWVQLHAGLREYVPPRARHHEMRV